MQKAYITVFEEAVEELYNELRAVWRQLTSPSTSLSLVLTILMAKEFTEWGRLITAVSEAAYEQNWSIPTHAGVPSGSVTYPALLPHTEALICTDIGTDQRLLLHPRLLSPPPTPVQAHAARHKVGILQIH